MTCTYNGTEYSEGALICANGRELVCRGGDWHENGETCGDPADIVSPPVESDPQTHSKDGK